MSGYEVVVQMIQNRLISILLDCLLKENIIVEFSYRTLRWNMFVHETLPQVVGDAIMGGLILFFMIHVPCTFTT